jgi:hypothetical protein
VVERGSKMLPIHELRPDGVRRSHRIENHRIAKSVSGNTPNWKNEE